jgi:glycerophosphoryl diester phosphodiesterase
LQSGQLIGIDISESLLQQLSQWQLSAKNPVYIQSFEVSNLWWMRQHGLSRYQVSAQLVQLIGDISGTALYPASNFAQPWDLVHGKPVHGLQMHSILQRERFHYGDLLTDAGLQFLASYVDGIGPWKEQWYQHNAPMIPIDVTRQLKLKVHPYTFRAEANFLPKDVVDLNTELQQRFRQGVDGVFTDHIRIALEARQAVCRR